MDPEQDFTFAAGIPDFRIGADLRANCTVDVPKGHHTMSLTSLPIPENHLQTPLFKNPPRRCVLWVAVKELKLSYYIGKTILITTYTYADIYIYICYPPPH